MAARTSGRFSFSSGALRRREHLAAYLLVAPALIVLTIYVFVPIGYTIYISFQDLRLGAVSYVGATNPNSHYVNPNAHNVQTFFGFRNWDNLLHHDGVFDLAVRNTIVMVGSATLLGTLGALLAALLVTQRLPFIGAFRTAYFFPAAISQVVTGLVFLWLFDENFGLVNHLLGFVGLGPYLWQDDARYLLLSLTLAAAWLTASYNLPIFAAALQNVPRAQQEAAALDGAGSFRTFWHVVLPTLRPATWFVAISSMVAVSQMLGLYDALGQDSVESSTLVKYMFARAFYYNDIDYAGAIGCIMIVALTLIALLQLWISEREATA
ncbi:MAG TPA: sugar ABC transporter permease [Chloroflexota bacterium]|nr:sugar ABC transporter permease [Chloroflexota bacterium]